MCKSCPVKLVVIGLDSAPAHLVLNRWRDQLPTLASIMETGVGCVLESTHPPITVPAWSSMMTGLDSGQLGFYGFRNRRSFSYEAYSLASSTDVQQERVWDAISRSGRQVVLLGVPQTYPVRPVNGWVIGDFLTPSTDSPYTYPQKLKEEVERVSGGYVLDVEGFRTEDKEGLLERVYDKTRKHFAVAQHLMDTKPWDYFMMVEMGTDRIQHGFWSYMDPDHPKYHQGNPFESAILDYYRYLDGEVGDLLSLAPSDAAVLVVSDHGAKGMDGGIAVNEWLIQQGYLTLKSYPSERKPISEVEVDWDRTRAWGRAATIAASS